MNVANSKKYPRAFKDEAVRLLVTSGKSVRELARELGVTDTSLSNWKRRALRNGDHPELARPKDPKVDYSVLQQENLRLKRELETTREQRDILKKSLGILSQDPLRKDMP